MQIETLLDEPKERALELLGKPNAVGKVSVNQSKLVRSPKDRSEIPVIKSAQFEEFTVQELASGSIEVLKAGEIVDVAKPELRRIASKLGLSVLNSNGNPMNTRQVGSMVIRELQSKVEADA